MNVLASDRAAAMKEMISFTVYGVPQTAGSKRAFAIRRGDGSIVVREGGAPVISVVDDNPRSKSWKQDVAWAAREIYRGALLEGPLAVSMRFYRQRPKGHFRSNGQLGKNGEASHAPTTKPDVLKLARAVEDALTGVVWRDDAQIVSELIEKLWGEPARCEVRITTTSAERSAAVWLASVA